MTRRLLGVEFLRQGGVARTWRADNAHSGIDEDSRQGQGLTLTEIVFDQCAKMRKLKRLLADTRKNRLVPNHQSYGVNHGVCGKTGKDRHRLPPPPLYKN